MTWGRALPTDLGKEVSTMTLMKSIEKDFPQINKAAGDFLLQLSGTDIYRNILLSAEIAGLSLLRASNVDIARHEAGSLLLGAIADDTYEQIQRFMIGWSLSNGLNPCDIGKEDIPDELIDYVPTLAQLEAPFYEVCAQNNLREEYYPFVATLAALKLVLAGEKQKLLASKTGLSLVYYHVISGSKTVLYETDNHP